MDNKTSASDGFNDLNNLGIFGGKINFNETKTSETLSFLRKELAGSDIFHPLGCKAKLKQTKGISIDKIFFFIATYFIIHQWKKKFF